jgi:hypothetical protein
LSQLGLVSGYCFDTDVLINLIRRNYPDDIFPALREDVEEMIDAGRISCPEEVLQELKQLEASVKDQDMVLPWAKARPLMFVPLDDEQGQLVTETLVQHPGASGYPLKRKPANADVFLVALAEKLQWTVVTAERRQERSDRIPNVCDTRGVPWLDLFGFIREQGWRYVRGDSPR